LVTGKSLFGWDHSHLRRKEASPGEWIETVFLIWGQSPKLEPISVLSGRAEAIMFHSALLA
jgi:hypothetical protein